MKRVRVLLFALLLASCAAFQPATPPTATAGAPFVLRQEENPYAPLLEDVNLKEDGVVLTSVSLSERYDLNPIRAELHLLGSMPSVCSQLRVKVRPPNAQYEIVVDVYSVSDLKTNCERVFQQFKASLLLGQYSPGQYTVWVNGVPAGTLASY